MINEEIKELFEPIEGYENYQISNLGRVFNSKSGKYLKTFLDGAKVRVKLYRDNKYKNCTVHTLVAQHFLHNEFDYEFIVHIDKNVLNNCVTNLLYAQGPKNNILQNEKTCSMCGETKAIVEFVKSSKQTYAAYCKVCDKTRKAKYDQIAYKTTQQYNEVHTLEGRAALLRNRCKSRATECNLEFNLSKEFILARLILGVCEATGIPLEFTELNNNPYAPSIDRIDSSEGYIESNVQITTMIYNFCKNEFDQSVVQDFLRKARPND